MGDDEPRPDSAGEAEQDEPAEQEQPPSADKHLPLLTHRDDRPKPTPYPRTEPESEPDPEQPAARPGRKRRAAGRTLVGLISAAALVATGYAYTTLDTLRDNVHTTDALGGQDTEQAPPANDGATDILLVGTDARTDMQGNPLPTHVLKTLRTEEKAGINTDTLILLRIPHDGGKTSAISIPRDTWVDVPQEGQHKINAPYGLAKVAAARELRAGGETDQAKIERESDQAGRKLLVRTVQELTQVRIDHYAEVNLLGFYLITEALGGVPVCLNRATMDKDSGAEFRAGTQTLDGAEALSFVRQRKNLPRGDLDRIRRQQAFLGSALHKAFSAGTLTDRSKLTELTEALHRSLVLDESLDLLGFAEQARDLAKGDLEFVTIPVVAVGARSQDGQSIVQVDVRAVRAFVSSLVRDEPQSSAGGGGGAAPSAPEGVTCVN